MSRKAWGFGLATVCPDGTILDVWYPEPQLGESKNEEPSNSLRSLEKTDQLRGVEFKILHTTIDLDDDPRDVADIYLRLHLLSWRLVLPNSFSLEGIYDILPTVAWTNIGPVSLDSIDDVRFKARLESNQLIRVLSLDKVPRMVDYVTPSNVRIYDGNRVRLGAYLSEGTTVTPAGFIDFNAGTLGAATIEGRINKGVTVDEGSHIGGGASTMGDLSTDPHKRVSIGKNCHIGNNAGVGIPLGDNCHVAEGLYITRNNTITVLPTGGIAPGREGYIENPPILPAKYFAGVSHITYRRNSQSGVVEAIPSPDAPIEILQEFIEQSRLNL
ncbi:MAG: 2,3,4,5-tetrahydropyridine-2,6-dicarboxylate N-succinyltransferase [Actinomycetaceae bacterium]|nr:2,3,4,5-tetrahydropyridine-2,6-dicarboxylate N-succinyltransferase [Actinomycetaceae bacterium]